MEGREERRKFKFSKTLSIYEFWLCKMNTHKGMLDTIPVHEEFISNFIRDKISISKSSKKNEKSSS